MTTQLNLRCQQLKIKSQQPRDYCIRERKASEPQLLPAAHRAPCLPMKPWAAWNQQLQMGEGVHSTTCKCTEFRKGTPAAGLRTLDIHLQSCCLVQGAMPGESHRGQSRGQNQGEQDRDKEKSQQSRSECQTCFNTSSRQQKREPELPDLFLRIRRRASSQEVESGGRGQCVLHSSL